MGRHIGVTFNTQGSGDPASVSTFSVIMLAQGCTNISASCYVETVILYIVIIVSSAYN